jgi:hypothetical protein
LVYEEVSFLFLVVSHILVPDLRQFAPEEVGWKIRDATMLAVEAGQERDVGLCEK